MVSARDALDFIDPNSTDYQEWIHVGMALKHASESDPSINWQTFDDWSSRDTRPGMYKSGECQKKWDSFNGNGITEGTIFKKAFEGGYAVDFKGEQALDWDSTISYDGNDPHSEEIIQYINLLYEDDDIVNYVFSTGYDEERDKYYPVGNGVNRLAGDIKEDLAHYGGDIPSSLGDYNHKAGGWIRINPMDGKGSKNKNVVDFRYCLIESDQLSLQNQFKKILELKLPCAAITYSGSKSLHAIVHVDAETEEEYTKRVKWIYEVLNDNDFPIDQNNKNPSRMSRLPGLLRGSNYQTLIRGNTGLKNFHEWEDYIKNGLDEDELPDIMSYEDIINDPPPLKPELIKGVLRQGHKMIISGASKSGKSFCLIDLMTCIAEGKKWLGADCKQGKVLYINLEIDAASFWDRIIKVYKAKNWQATPANIDVWNLRGFAMSAEKLVNYIIRRAYEKNYSLIVLDPIYKIQAGDENSAGDIAKFTNELDRLVTELNCSVVYCHHHSKGAQSFKRAMDRSSGSGVFARDADAIIDIIELSNETYKDMEYYGDLRAFRVEGTLREFESFKPVNVFYDFPVYRVDEAGILDEAKTLDDYLNSKQNRTKKVTAIERFEQAFNMLSVGKDKVKVNELLTELNIKKRRLQDMMKEYNETEGRKTYTLCKDYVVKI